MSRSAKLCMGTLILVMIAMVGLTGIALGQDNTVDLVVSPNVLNLGSNGGVVTLHAEIAYSAVVGTDLEVDGQSLPIASTFADSRGELVIKCRLATVKSMVAVGDATFDLTVYTGGATYTGTDTINVIAKGK